MNMNESDIPPVPSNLYPYLKEIAERLFSGHAAIMVGSGLSKNAKRHSPSCRSFPDWSELGDQFYEKLYERKPDADNRYLSASKLAHEVEAAIGRPALDQLLRDAIPDQDYEPSPLHVKLLDLPWTDIFTTNYDTLLERACRSVTSRRYDIVVNSDDLVYSERPRIVKLHGSFPTGRPFIVTDEDYRRYPDAFAPFVNTVRQALLENTLCLIGFSGDDPNFLQWIGWIHDNLGRRNSPKIYLVGTLSLSDSQRKLLERRNIVTVDMSEYRDIEADDHGRALGRFVAFLQSSKGEFNTLDWPRGDDPVRPDDGADRASKIRELLPIWKAQRRSYPGWVIVPEARRRALWSATRRWINNPPVDESLPCFIDLEFSYELIWRMERCQCPISSNQIDFLEATLNRYLSADVDKCLETLSAPLEDHSLHNPTRNEVRNMCHHILLALLRYYREEGQIEEWTRTCARLDDRVTTMSPEHKAQLYYERALLALFELNPEKLKQRIKGWPIDNSLPFWEAKRAGLLAEVGQVHDATRILENSLTTIRVKNNLKPVMTDYSLVSRESLVMLLLRSVQLSSVFPAGELEKWQEDTKEFKDRWHVLRQYDCDPWNELEVFKHALDRAPVDSLHVTEKPEFDIGDVTQTRHIGIVDHETLTAYQFLRFCEDAGIPFRIPGCSIAVKSATGTLSRIATYSPYWAMATLVRIGSDEVVDRIFDRAALASMDTVAVDRLVDRYLNALELATADIGARVRHWDENFGTQLAKVVPEILSRLCCRCSRSAHDQLLEFLISVYRSDRRRTYHGIQNLAKRLLKSVSVDQRIDLIPKLLNFPVLSNLDAIEKREYLNPFIFLDVPRDALSRGLEVADKDIDRFIDSAFSEDRVERRWATRTLGRLHRWGLLEVETTERFADALWGRLDDDGLPSDTEYLPHAFLTLPHPAEINPSEVFRKWVHNQQFPVQEDRTSIPIGGQSVLCNAIIGASRYLEWSDDDVSSIVHRLVAWWDTDKKYMKWVHVTSPYRLIADQARGRFFGLVGTLVAVISPRFNPDDDNDVRECLERVVREMREHGLPALRLEAACLHMFPEKRDAVLQRIDAGLASPVNEAVEDALRAVSVMSELIRADATDRERADLVRSLDIASQILRWRRDTGLGPAIYTVAEVMARHPWSFSGNVRRSVLEGLHHMIGDSAIRTPSSPRQDRKKDDSDISKKLIVRRAAARLAYTVSKHYERRSESVPDVIKKWESICRSDDEFAEIRNQWFV